MTINFTKDSLLSTTNLDDDKEWVKETIDIYNDYLKESGTLFANTVREGLCVKPKKEFHKDGWIYDQTDSEYGLIKVKFKKENGNLIVILNEEKNIVNLAFDE